MAEITLDFEVVTSPSSYEAQESMLLCRNEFELSHYEARGIVARLLNPAIISPNRFHYIVAKNDDQIVGLAIFYFLSEVNLGYLEYITVKPEYRGHGVGRRIYEKVIETLKQDSQHLSGIIFEVRNISRDLKARKEFFLRIGAIPIDLSFYPLREEIINSGLLLMLHPISELKMTWPVMAKTLDNLNQVLYQ